MSTGNCGAPKQESLGGIVGLEEAACKRISREAFVQRLKRRPAAATLAQVQSASRGAWIKGGPSRSAVCCRGCVPDVCSDRGEFFLIIWRCHI